MAAAFCSVSSCMRTVITKGAVAATVGSVVPPDTDS
jgi:hypothetical protein